MFNSMTDIEKAIEIAEKNHKVYDDYYDSLQECVTSAREMAEYKNNQFIAILDTINRNAFSSHEEYVAYIKAIL